MAGLKPDEFRDRVQGMASWLASVDGQASASVWHLPTAIQLVGRGFVFPEHLDGLLDSDVHRFSVDEKERCLLRAALPAARERREHSASGWQTRWGTRGQHICLLIMLPTLQKAVVTLCRRLRCPDYGSERPHCCNEGVG